MVVKLHALTEHAPVIRPARAKRQWMDDFPDRHAYRCLPLSIANAYGWEALCPVPIEIRWNGGNAVEDIVVTALKPLPGGAPVEHFCRSNFSRGIVTFHLDYVIQTEADWELLATGPFNDPKTTAAPLTGVMESDWLPYPFTMNWQLLQPGITRFEEGEPFCFFLPVPKRVLPVTTLEIHRLSDEPELQARHDQFKNSRNEFMQRIHAGDQEAIKEAWQRHYFVGRHPDGVQAAEHLNKLRLNEPVDLRKAPEPGRRVRIIRGARPAGATVAGSDATPTLIESQIDGRPAILSQGLSAAQPDARWGADSPLNNIPTYSGTVLIPNRARMDAEGRVTPGPTTRVVSSRAEAEALGLDFLYADGVVSPEDCAQLCGAFEALQELVFGAEDVASFWDKRGVWYADVMKHQPETAALMRKVLGAAFGEMRRFWKLKVPVFIDGLHLMSWKAGLSMAPHADNAYPDGKPHEVAYRDLSGVIYLNDGYEGGELYMTALDVLVKPRVGSMVSMTGGFHHEHGVTRVESGLRITLPFFASFDTAKADPALVQTALDAARD